MSTELVTFTTPTAIAKPSFYDLNTTEMIREATGIASALAGLISKQKLYSDIQGKKYVKYEGWLALGSIIGILPKEEYVNELPDGSYEAKVQLLAVKTGMVVGGASAVCSIDELRWAKAEKYARRSMAVTRATGKAYRLTLGWIMPLAGYEGTPAEEMPEPFSSPAKLGVDTPNVPSDFVVIPEHFGNLYNYKDELKKRFGIRWDTPKKKWTVQSSKLEELRKFVMGENPLEPIDVTPPMPTDQDLPF